MPEPTQEQESYESCSRALLIASRGCEPGSAREIARPTWCVPIYRLIRSPALAEIIGDGRPWTVSMISLLSMP